MSDIDDFKKVMKQWISTDDQIRSLSVELKQLRQERNRLTQNACKIIQTNHWETRKIEAIDSQISFNFKKEYSTISFAFIEKHLAEIIPDPDNVARIITHLRNKREVRAVPDLKRVLNNRIDGGYETE